MFVGGVAAQQGFTRLQGQATGACESGLQKVLDDGIARCDQDRHRRARPARARPEGRDRPSGCSPPSSRRRSTTASRSCSSRRRRRRSRSTRPCRSARARTRATPTSTGRRAMARSTAPAHSRAVEAGAGPSPRPRARDPQRQRDGDRQVPRRPGRVRRPVPDDQRHHRAGEPVDRARRTTAVHRHGAQRDEPGGDVDEPARSINATGRFTAPS